MWKRIPNRVRDIWASIFAGLFQVILALFIIQPMLTESGNGIHVIIGLVGLFTTGAAATLLSIWREEGN